MKLPKEFDTYKFHRTYLYGTKKTETNYANKITGESGNNYEYPDCDWMAVRDYNDKFFFDVVHVIFSWKKLFKQISYVLGFISLLSILSFDKLFFMKFIFIISTGLSFLFYLAGLYLNIKQKKRTKLYYNLLALTIVHLNQKYNIKTTI